MGWNEINLDSYVGKIKENLNIETGDEIIKKDLLLTLILAEFEKHGLGDKLIFKGGTLLSRNYLEYHRFSEDLDFVHIDSNDLRELSRNKREKQIKEFIDFFCPKLKEISNKLGLEFSEDRSNTKYCSILHGRTVYTFRVYYSENKYIKFETNFAEKLLNSPDKVSVKAITDFFDSKELLFVLNLDYRNFNVLSYSLEEIILEKYRAVLTRKNLQERDLFDLFLIRNSLDADKEKIIEKIKGSSLIKREIQGIVKEKLELLDKNEFFKSEENIEELAIKSFSKQEFEKFKEKIKPKLIEICKDFLDN